MSQSFFLLAIIEFVDAHMSRQLFPGVLTVLTGKRFTQQKTRSAVCPRHVIEHRWEFTKHQH